MWGPVGSVSLHFLLGRPRVSSGPEALAEACYGSLLPSGLVFDPPTMHFLIRSFAGKANKGPLSTGVSEWVWLAVSMEASQD